MLDAFKPEVIAVDEHQKLLKVGENTLFVTWNKYTNSYEGQVYKQVQDKYGRFVNEFVTGVTGMSEQEVIQEALKI